MFARLPLTIISLAIAGAAPIAPAVAQSASSYSVVPAGPLEIRNTYVSPSGAVFVVDNVKGQIVLCYPDTKNNVDYVKCTAPTKLP